MIELNLGSIIFRLLDDQFIKPRAGFDPPFVCSKCNDLLNEKVDASTNQATTAGLIKSCSLLFFSYKVVMTLNDPVGNSVELRDLKPFTIYNLDVRARSDKLIFGTLNFSTASKFLTFLLTRKI